MSLPTKIVAGDNKSWTLEASTAAEIVTYSFRDGDGDGINVTGVNDGSTHTFTIAPGQSAQLVPGWYDASKVVEDGAGDRTTTVNVSRLEVDPNPLVKPDETYNAKMLAELKRIYQERLEGNTNFSGNIAGRSWSKAPIESLYEQLQIFERRVLREKLQGRRNQNRSARYDLIVKF